MMVREILGTKKRLRHIANPTQVISVCFWFLKKSCCIMYGTIVHGLHWQNCIVASIYFIVIKLLYPFIVQILCKLLLGMPPNVTPCVLYVWDHGTFWCPQKPKNLKINFVYLGYLVSLKDLTLIKGKSIKYNGIFVRGVGGESICWEFRQQIKQEPSSMMPNMSFMT